MKHGALAVLADEILVAQAAEGNMSAFDELVNRHFRRIFSIAYARLSDADVAEELTQEVFLRTYLHLGSLRDASSFIAWASAIARNMAANWRRNNQSKSRVVRMVPLADVGPEAPDLTNPSPREQLELVERQRQLRESIEH